MAKKWKTTKNHWTKGNNVSEIKKRLLESRNNNLEYKEKIKKRMTGENNPSKIPEYRDKMIKSKKISPLVPRGVKHHAWKGGVTPEHNRLRGSLEYIIWRNEVYKRDNWTCRICGIHCQKGNIVAHHIKKFSNFPELRFLVENGLTLCRKCHIKIEKPYVTHT